MKQLSNLIGACLSIALLSACGGGYIGATTPGAGMGQPSSALSRGRANNRPMTQESVLYTFLGHSDGGGPYAGLLSKNNEFYGTTFGGGAKGHGTAFELSPSGTKTTLYTFQGGTDASNPQAGLTAGRNGVLYGDTVYGGGTTLCTGGCGTVYKLTPSGSGYTERVIYAFQSGNDGLSPVGGILFTGGAIYGTTAGGGGTSAACPGPPIGCGTVFELTRSGSNYVETVLYRFQGGTDGLYPRGTLIADRSGALYGTTLYGGSGTCSDPSGFSGCGTVFKLTPTSSGYTESIIYSFQGGTNDGALPHGGLLAGKRGAFYGATGSGGTTNRGTVFELTPSGSSYVERVIYAFQGGSDGAVPSDENGLYADSTGALYGTTIAGGKAACGSNPCGTVFKLTPSGSSYTETVLHRFQGAGDGADPRGSLVADATGTLYGTTFGGAKKGRGCSGGCGVVFKVSP